MAAAPASPDTIKPQQDMAVARGIANRAETTSSSREDQRSATAAKAYREKKQEIGVRGLLGAWNSGETTSAAPLPDAAKTKDIIKNQIPVDNTDPAHPDSTKQNLAIQKDNVLRAVIEGDTAALEAGVGFTSDHLIAPLKEVMHQIPELKVLADKIDALPDSANEWIRFATQQLDAGRASGDKRFIDAVRAKYTELMGREGNPAQLHKAAERELMGLKETHDAKNDEFIANENSITETQAKIASYKDTTTPDALGKKLIDQRAAVKDDVSVAQYEAQQGELTNLEAQLTDRKDARNSTTNAIRHREIDSEIKTLNEQIAAKKAEMKPYEQEVQKLQDMEAEKAGLPASLAQLHDRATALETEIEGIAWQVTAAEAKLSEVSTPEEDFGKEMGNIIADAFKETMTARYTAEQEGIIAMLDKQIAAETDVYVKAALMQLRDGSNRWSEWGKTRFRRKDTRVFEKDTAREDLMALKSGGQEQFMAKFLHGKINPDTGAVYSPDEISGLLADKNYMDKIAPKAVGLLLKQAATHGMLSEKDAEAIGEHLMDTSWGQAAIEEALTMSNNNEVSHDTAKKLMAEAKKHKKFGMWLLLTMMFPVLGVGVGAFVLSKGIVTLPKTGHETKEEPKKIRREVVVEPTPEPPSVPASQPEAAS